MNEKLDALSLIEEIKDEQWWKLVELKKFCLSEATDLYDEPEKIVKTAQEYMDFLMGDFKPVVTWYNSEHPTSDVMAGWYKMMDGMRQRSGRLMNGMANYLTTTEHPQPEHEKVLDLERILECRLLMKTLYSSMIFGGVDYMVATIRNDTIRFLDKRGAAEAILHNNSMVSVLDKNGKKLHKKTDLQISELLKPYFIDKPDGS